MFTTFWNLCQHGLQALSASLTGEVSGALHQTIPSLSGAQIEAIHVVQLVGLHSRFSDQTSHEILTLLNLFCIRHTFVPNMMSRMVYCDIPNEVLIGVPQNAEVVVHDSRDPVRAVLKDSSGSSGDTELAEVADNIATTVIEAIQRGVVAYGFVVIAFACGCI